MAKKKNLGFIGVDDELFTMADVKREPVRTTSIKKTSDYYDRSNKKQTQKKANVTSDIRTIKTGQDFSADSKGNLKKLDTNKIAEEKKKEVKKKETKKDKANALVVAGKTAGNVATNMGEGALKTGESTLDTANTISDRINNWLSHKVNTAVYGKKTADEQLKKDKKNQVDFLKRNLTQELEDATGFSDMKEDWEKDSLIKSGNFGGKVAQGVGGMVPSLVAGQYLGFDPKLKSLEGLSKAAKAKAIAANVGRTYVSQLPANAILTASSYGSGVEQALNEGANIEQARKFGLANAAIEQGTEMLTGGVPGLGGKGGLDGVIDPLIGKAKNPYAKAALQTLYRAGGEGLEEAAAEVLSPIARKIYSDEKIDWKQTGKQALEAGLIGAATGAILNGPQTALDFSNARVENQISKLQNLNEVERNALTDLTIKRKNGEQLSNEDMVTLMYLNDKATTMQQQQLSPEQQALEQKNQLQEEMQPQVPKKSTQQDALEALQNEGQVQNNEQVQNEQLTPEQQELQKELIKEQKEIQRLQEEQQDNAPKTEQELLNDIKNKKITSEDKIAEAVRAFNLEQQENLDNSGLKGEMADLDVEIPGLENNNQQVKASKNTQETVQETQPIQNIQNETTTLKESATQYGYKGDAESLNNIQNALQKRGIDGRFDASLFENNDTNAMWIKGKDGKRQVVFNPNASENTIMEEIAVHELSHDIMSSENSRIALKPQEILDYVKKLDGYAEARQNLEETYSKMYDKNSAEFQSLVDEEVVADVLGRKLGNQEFVNQLTTSNPSFARKIYNWVVDKVNSLVNSGGKVRNEKLYWQNVKNNFEKAYNMEYQNGSNQINTKYAIKQTSDGVQYVEDNQLMKNSNMTQRDVFNSIKNTEYNFGDGDTAYIVGWLKSNNKNVNNKSMYNELFTRYPSIFKNIEDIKDFNRLVNYNTDELLKTSKKTQDAIADINNKHSDWNIESFDTRRSILYDSTNDKAYEIDFSIANLKNGKKIAYAKKMAQTSDNILNKIKTSSRSENSPIASSETSISQYGENVKPSITTSENIQDNQGRTLTKEQQERYKDVSDKLRDENGNIKVYHHGTKRADRVGNVFDPARATSGPMAFFTDNSEIAKGYSESKQDTSISREYDTEYDLFKANNKSLDDYWNSLSKSQQDKINETGRNIGLDEDFENAIYEENASKNSFGDQYDYYLRDSKNNGLKALYKLFIEDGYFLFEDMNKFQDVLKLAGVKNVEYLDPYKVDSKVYDVYLNIKNPFDTSEISNDIVAKLKEASKTAKTEETYSADMWDKSNRSPESWIEALEDDMKEGTTHAWTSIPDWVTDVLKANGYDGIVDTGGKGGGQAHQVAIPFYSNQIKNIDNTNPTDSNDIRYSKESTTWSDFLNKKIKGEGTKTTLGELKQPVGKLGEEYYKSIGADDKVAKILSERPKAEKQSISQRIKEGKANLREQYQYYKRNFVDKGEAVYRLGKQLKNKQLYAKYDKMGTAIGEANYHIGESQTNLQGKNYTNFIDNNGNQKAMSLNQIWEGIDPEIANEYLAHQLNVDRYSQLNEDGRKLNDSLQKQVKQGKLTQEEVTDILKKGDNNKFVFGKSVTAQDSRNRIAQLEAQHPELKTFGKNVWQYGKNQLQNMVDAGLISQQQANQWMKENPHYVRLQRDVQKGSDGILGFDNNGRAVVNKQIKEFKGSTADILPFKDSMAQYTLDVAKSIRMNQFGQELAKTIGLGSTDNVINSIDENFGINPELLKSNGDGTYSLTIFDNGVATVVPINEGIYEALTPNKHYKFEETLPFKGLRKFDSVRKGLLTDKNPLFLATNMIKDAFDAPLNSKHPVAWAKNYPRAVKEIMNNGKYYQQYKALGGLQNTYFDYQGFKQQGSKFNPVTWIEKGNNAIEQFPRLAEFMATIDSGGTVEEAMYNAAEVTTNFKRGGQVTKTANRNGATFLNASVQGFSKFVRNFTDIQSPRQATQMLAKVVALGIAPGLLNDIMWDDDDEYKEMQDYQKDNYYLFKGKNGKWIRIPKGRAVSIFQSATRRTRDYLKGNKDAYKGFGTVVANQIAPNNPFENNVISPWVDIARNKSWSGNAIVNQSMEKRPDAEQFNEKTDEFSKWIGKQLNVSPMKVNYIIDQYSGVIGDIGLPMITPRSSSDTSNPIIAAGKSKFSFDAVNSNKNVGVFYDTKEEIEKKKNSINAKPIDKAKNSYMTSQNFKLSELYNKQREIQSDPNLDKREKYKQANKVQKEINEFSKQVVEDVKNAEKHDYYVKIGDYYYKKVVKDGKDTFERDTSKTIPTESFALYDYFRDKYYRSKER